LTVEAEAVEKTAEWGRILGYILGNHAASRPSRRGLVGGNDVLIVWTSSASGDRLLSFEAP